MNTSSIQETPTLNQNNVTLKNAEEQFEKLALSEPTQPEKNKENDIDVRDFKETPIEDDASIEKSISLVQTNSGQVEPTIEEQINPTPVEDPDLYNENTSQGQFSNKQILSPQNSDQRLDNLYSNSGSSSDTTISSSPSPKPLDKGKGKEVVNLPSDVSTEYIHNQNNELSDDDQRYQQDDEFVNAVPIESQISPTSNHSTEIAAGVDPLDMRYSPQESMSGNSEVEPSNLRGDLFPASSVLEAIPSHITNSVSRATDPEFTDISLPTQQQVIQSVVNTVPKTEYQMKSIEWMPLGSTTPRKLSIITQNENGPCPLLALCNVLLLRGDIEIKPSDRPVVDDEYLTSLLGEYLLDLHSSESEDLSNFNNALAVIPLLQRGLDVNVRFDSIHGFEHTPELSMFEAFKVDLIHGWIADPEEDWNTYRILTEKCINYNTAVDLVVKGDEAGKDANLSAEEKDSIVHESLVVRQFLEHTATQLTYHGLLAISTTLPQNHLAVLFRNNHFSTLYKRGDGELYTLVTDAGFLDSPNAVWESLRDIDQIDSEFVTGSFQKISVNEDSINQAEIQMNENEYENLAEQERMDQDLALALNLQQQEDAKKHEPAKTTKKQQQQKNDIQPGRSEQHSELLDAREQTSSVASSSFNQKKKRDNCVIC